MLQGLTRYGKSGLKAEKPWDARDSFSLKVKVLGEQVTYGLEII